MNIWWSMVHSSEHAMEHFMEYTNGPQEYMVSHIIYDGSWRILQNTLWNISWSIPIASHEYMVSRIIYDGS
jgi:hypothetical protein